MPVEAQGFTLPRGVRSHRFRLYVCLLAITAFSVVVAYWRSFGTLAAYDDEGTMMLTAQRFFHGQVLYEGARSPYGPVFYAYQWVAHAAAGMTVSHDSVRFVSVAFWVVSSLALFALVYRLTHSLAVSLVAHFFGFRALGFVGAEAAHPQEACIFFLLLLGLAATCRTRGTAIGLMGALAGALTLTKINLGVFVIAALGVVLAWALPSRRARQILFPAAAAGAVILPALLMSGHGGDGWTVRYALLVILSLVGAILATWSARLDPPIRRRDVACLCLGFAAVLVAIAAFPLANGSTLRGMFENLVIFPYTFYTTSWSVPLQVTPVGIAWCFICLAGAWLVARGSVGAGAVAATKLVFAAGVGGLLLVYDFDELVSFATPLLWLVAIEPPRQPDPRRTSLARPLLAVMGVLQVLYAYPVAGSQAQFATVIPTAIAAVCAWDALPWLAAFLPRTVRLGPALAMLCLAMLYATTSARAAQTFGSLEPLRLRGAQRLRAKPDLAKSLRELVAEARSCSMLITEPGLFSLNFLSGIPAPTTMTLGEWVLHPNDAEQEAMIRELEAQPQACAVVYPAALQVWTQGRDISTQPLVRYIDENYSTVKQTSGYLFKVRKPILIGAYQDQSQQ